MKVFLALLLSAAITYLCSVLDNAVGLTPAQAYLIGALNIMMVIGLMSLYEWLIKRRPGGVVINGGSGAPIVEHKANGKVTITINGATINVDRRGNISCVSTPGDFCMGSRS